MSNESFDINKIVYASKNTKITLKTKEKLDELAAQVALWNSEINSMSANKENKIISSSKPPLANNRRILGNFNSPNPDNSFSPSNFSGRKSYLDVKSSVKAKAAFFEALSTGEPNDKKSEFKTPKSVKNLEFPGIFNTPKSNIKFEKPKIPTIKEDKLEICENMTVLHIPKLDDKVFYEDLTEEFEGSLPSPPPLLHDISNSEIESVKCFTPNIDIETVDCQGIDIDLNKPTWKFNNSWEANDSIEEDLTRVSSLDSSSGMGSFYDEFVNEFAKISHEKDTESLPTVMTNQEQQKKIRRSLSFSDKVKYIEPSSDDEPVVKTNSPIRKSSQPHQSDESSSSSSSSNRSYELYEEKPNGVISQDSAVGKLMQKSHSLIDELKEFSLSLNYKPGCSEHLKKCLSLVRNNLRYASIAESDYYKPIICNEIVCDANLYNILLSVKVDYVPINYKSLSKLGYGSKLNKLSSVFHVVLLGRSEAGTIIYESNVFTFVKRYEAEKFGLKFEGGKWLNLFDNLNFSMLRSGFKLVFDLYCMSLEPNKSLISASKGTPKSRRTPMKKLFSDSPSKPSVDSPLIFTNVGTFRLSQLDMTSDSDVVERKIILPQHCPFNGDVQLTGSLSFNVTSQCRGRLNIYMEIGGVGAWAFRDCQITYKSIIGGRISELTGEIEDIDVEILFCTFNGTANLCDFSVCAKANTFSVLLDENSIRKKMPVNRRLSADGEKKCRFLAAADSREDAKYWCDIINNYHTSFLDWSKRIKLI